MNTIKLKAIARSILNSIFGIFGIDVYFCWKSNKYDRVLLDLNAMNSFYSSNERVQLYYEGMKKTNVVYSDNIYKKLRYYGYQQVLENILAKEIDGDIAECGVWKGHSAYIWAKLLSMNDFKGEFHIFDSFEKSLSEFQAEDTNVRFPDNKKEIVNMRELFVSTEEEVKKNLAEFKFIKYYDGWIPERFHEVSDRRFSFVHIDCDLYQPTVASLSFFYPRLSKGGCIAISAYGLTQVPGSKKAVDQFLSNENYTMFFEIPSSGSLLIK